MSSLFKLSDADREHFAEVVESSHTVVTRYQLFSWAQSSLQSLVPHEILICGVEDGSRQGMAMHRFSASRYFRDDHFNAVADPLHGLRAQVAIVAEGQRRGVIFAPSEQVETRAVDRELYEFVKVNELRNLAALLVVGASGKIEGLYAFARVPAVLDARLAHLIELITPHLHSAFIRVVVTEREISSTGTQRSGRLVTPRQEEILCLIKEGKTNVEIARLLDCSPWTIKNHIQAILRRLDSNTRTHAISRAMSLGIIKPD